MTETHTFIGAPAVGGMLYSAPAGTELPTDATTPLDYAFAHLGAIGEDGITRSGEPSIEPVKDAGGRIIRNVVTEHPLSYGLTFLESLNVAVLRELYGAENVSTDGRTITIGHVEGFIAPARVYVIELEDGATRKRIVIKNAQATQTGDTTYSSATPGEVYESTLNVLAPGDGTKVRVIEHIDLGYDPETGPSDYDDDGLQTELAAE